MSASGAGRRPSILVVDDDAALRSVMRAALEGAGCDVSEAGDGVAACESCEAREHEMLIADVVMPRMDGLAMCRELRRRPATAHVPILMATGLHDVASIASAFEAGATDFIAKPVDRLLLTHRVRYLLRAADAFRELRQRQDQLILAKDAAEAASRAKTDFLAQMSHELRTPLNAIIGFSTIMHGGLLGALSERYRDYARMIEHSGSHLLAIIDSMLELARAEANQLVLAEECVQRANAVAVSMGILRGLAEQADIHYRVDMDEDLPAFMADSAKIRQILINLLSNAIKFTPPGGCVTLTMKRDCEGWLDIRVADTGIGIPADRIAVALTPFGQTGSAVARKHGGTGIGLPIAKRLVELHGGTLDLRSEPGRGTVVAVRLPRERFRDAAPSRSG